MKFLTVTQEELELKLTINGEDKTPHLTERVTVTHTQGEAMRASFTYCQPSSVVPADLIESTVVITIEHNNTERTIFTGKVRTVSINYQDAFQIAIVAHQDLETYINALTDDAISAIAPNVLDATKWLGDLTTSNSKVEKFNRAIDAQGFLANFDFDGRLTLKNPEGEAPALTLTKCQSLKDSFAVSLVSLDTIINTFDIVIKVDGVNILTRKLEVNYEDNSATYDAPPLSQDLVLNALKATGYLVLPKYTVRSFADTDASLAIDKYIRQTKLDLSRKVGTNQITIPAGEWLIAKDGLRFQKSDTKAITNRLKTGAYVVKGSLAHLMKQFTQASTLTRTITVTNAESIKVYGTRRATLTFTIPAPNISKTLPSQESYNAQLAQEFNARVMRTFDAYLPAERNTKSLTDAERYPLGITREVFRYQTNALENYAINVARRRIMLSNRANFQHTTTSPTFEFQLGQLLQVESAPIEEALPIARAEYTFDLTSKLKLASLTLSQAFIVNKNAQTNTQTFARTI